MFFKIGSLKNLLLFTRKHLCWDLFLIKLRLELFLKKVLKRDSNTSVSCGIANFLRTAFFIEHLRWLLLTVLPQQSKISCSVYFLISRLRELSILARNVHKTLHK